MRLGPLAILRREEHHVALFDPIGRRELSRQLARHLVDPDALVQIVARGQRPLAGGEQLFALLWAGFAGQRARVRTDRQSLDALRLGERCHRLALEAALHHVVPDRRRADRPATFCIGL